MKNTLRKGFTLIEIMIVVAIIAILAAVAIPNFIKYRNESIENTCKSNMATIKTAAEAYLMANPSATSITKDDLWNSTGTGYIKEWPYCALLGKGTEAYSIAIDSASGTITVSCSEHTAASTGTDD